jgi:hypothetical protein
MKPHYTLKVDGNEKQWGPGRRQMLGTVMVSDRGDRGLFSI